jgi:hypothetical protein
VPIPDLEPAAYLIICERLELHGQTASWKTNQVGDDRAAGDDDCHGPTDLNLPQLKITNLF